MEGPSPLGALFSPDNVKEAKRIHEEREMRIIVKERVGMKLDYLDRLTELAKHFSDLDGDSRISRLLNSIEKDLGMADQAGIKELRLNVKIGADISEMEGAIENLKEKFASCGRQILEAARVTSKES